MMFVLEMFFKESLNISSKITTKPIIRRQLFKFNQDSDREIFLLQFIFSIFIFFASICTQNSLRGLREVQISKQPITCCKRKVRLSSPPAAKKKRFYLCAIADRLSF